MRLANCLNISHDDVIEKRHNVVLGFSLGNKYFTPDHIREYIRWAIENTKESVAVIIPDSIQAINYEVKNGYSQSRAMRVAMRKGQELETLVQNVIADLRIPTGVVSIVHWEDLKDDDYRHNLEIVLAAFTNDRNFRHSVVEMVAETPHIKNLKLSSSEHEKLALYIINELPILVSGLVKNGKEYTLFPYPGFARLDYLAIDLQEGNTYPEITKDLRMPHKLGLIELYVE